MNVHSMKTTALSLLPVRILWEEREVSSVHVILDTLGMALLVTVSNVTDLLRRLMLNIADIDECSTSMHTCVVQATCTDTEGSFSCTCNTGFTGDGTNCDSK